MVLGVKQRMQITLSVRQFICFSRFLNKNKNKTKTRGFLKSQFAYVRGKNKMSQTSCHFRREGGVLEKLCTFTAHLEIKN